MIDVSHGRALAVAAKRPPMTYFPEGFDHQNLEHAPEYFPTLRRFVDGLRAAAVAKTAAQPPPPAAAQV